VSSAEVDVSTVGLAEVVTQHISAREMQKAFKDNGGLFVIQIR